MIPYTKKKKKWKRRCPRTQEQILKKAFENEKINRIKAQMWTIFRSKTKACRIRSHKLLVLPNTHGKAAPKTINEDSNHQHVINAIPHGIMENRFNQKGKFDELKCD